MAIVRKKRQLAALSEENCEEHSWSDLAKISNVPRSQEDCNGQVSEAIEN